MNAVMYDYVELGNKTLSVKHTCFLSKVWTMIHREVCVWMFENGTNG